MKIDMHTHCLPVSACAHHLPELLPDMFREKNVDAFVLTNHYYPAHFNRLSSDLNEQANIYLDTFKKCHEAGKKAGVKVFFGAEIKLTKEPNAPEFLLYGLLEQDFLDSFPLYNHTQKELFDFCNEKDIIMVQSHPYRTEQGYAPCDMRYVHGVEVYNPHPRFDSRLDMALKLADENNKIKTAGSDFHIKSQAGVSGMIVPDSINDQFMLRDYLKAGEQILFDKSGIIYSSK